MIEHFIGWDFYWDVFLLVSMFGFGHYNGCQNYVDNKLTTGSPLNYYKGKEYNLWTYKECQ